MTTKGEQSVSAARTLAFTSHFPVLSPMNMKGDIVNNWEFFKQQWDDYEVATGLEGHDQKIRLTTLRSVMGKECVQIFLNLKLSEEQRNNVNECITALEAYFKPKRNVVYERYIFNTCGQIEGETVDGYVNRLKKHASTCGFGTLNDELIRDRLVLGINDEGTKLRLLKEDKLTLDKAINLCRSSEIATKQLNVLKQEATKSEGVHVVKQQRPQRMRRSTNTTARQPSKPHGGKKTTTRGRPYKCFHCGSSESHKKEACPAYGKECKICKKLNHFASVCMSKGQTRVHAVTQEADDSSGTDSDDDIFQIEELTTIKGKQGKLLVAKLEFKDVDKNYFTILDCQLDTGATCNVITHHDLVVINQNGDPKVSPSRSKLRLFDGSVMEPLGQANITIMKDKKEHCLEFQVVKGNNKPLLSAQTSRISLKITIGNETLQDVHQIQERKTLNKPLTKDELLNTYKDVFEGLGHIGQAKITVNSEAQPVQHAPRRIAITLHQVVKNKVLELEQKSIVVKETEPTDWISSMVVVAKPGKIRLCLDPKDLNNAVKRPKYQMPTLEEMLPKLNNAKVFSTLDAKDGFYQISLDEESSKLTTFWMPFGRYRYLRDQLGTRGI